MSSVAAPARTQASTLPQAVDFLERVYRRAEKTGYGKNLARWINPDESAKKEYDAVRDSVISDVIQASSDYVPGLEEKRKYYQARLDVVMPAVESAARAWAIDAMRRQVPKLVNLLLAAKSQASRLHVAAREVTTRVNLKEFVLPVTTPEEHAAITNQSRRGRGTVTTRLQRMFYMFAIQCSRDPVRSGRPPVPLKQRPGVKDPEAYETLFYLMAHPRGVRLVDAYASSADAGWKLTSETITESLTAITETQTSLATDTIMIWRLPPAVSVGVVRLGLGSRPDLTKFALAWATTRKSRIEAALETAADALLALDIVGGPIGREISGVLNFVLSAIGTAVSFLRDVEQDQAAAATGFADKTEKLSEGSRGVGTILQGLATIVAATALPGTLSRITGSGGRTGAAVAEAAQPKRALMSGADSRGLGVATEANAVQAAESRAVAGSVASAAPETKAAQRGLAERQPGAGPELQRNVDQRGLPSSPPPAEPAVAASTASGPDLASSAQSTPTSARGRPPPETTAATPAQRASEFDAPQPATAERGTANRFEAAPPAKPANATQLADAPTTPKPPEPAAASQPSGSPATAKPGDPAPAPKAPESATGTAPSLPKAPAPTAASATKALVDYTTWAATAFNFSRIEGTFRRQVLGRIRQALQGGQPHKLRFLLDPSTGTYWARPTGWDQQFLFHHPEIWEAGHVISNKSGQPGPLVIMTAYRNQYLSNTIEGLRLNKVNQGLFMKLGSAVDIDGILVEAGSARDMVLAGLLTQSDLDSALVVDLSKL